MSRSRRKEKKICGNVNFITLFYLFTNLKFRSCWHKRLLWKKKIRIKRDKNYEYSTSPLIISLLSNSSRPSMMYIFALALGWIPHLIVKLGMMTKMMRMRRGMRVKQWADNWQPIQIDILDKLITNKLINWLSKIQFILNKK